MIKTITVVDVASKPETQTPEGRTRVVVSPSTDGTRVTVAITNVDPGKSSELAVSDRTQVAYILEGHDAKITYTSRGKTIEQTSGRRTGVYLEPGERASVAATATPLKLLIVTVPKYTTRQGDAAAAGYVFEESQLRSLVDEKKFRERTFWVNKETGLSGSWDLQLGRMLYAPHAHSPRHVHHASKTASTAPEHFYFIEKGTGEVRHDHGTIPIGPGHLVFFPAGEWHQLVASDSGLDYIEFQAPFDFSTTMDADPLGKNWYIKGTDDGTGQPKLWVQS
jgi:mannose-6-phosphate isomerase-like protein (cupin superfamily)